MVSTISRTLGRIPRKSHAHFRWDTFQNISQIAPNSAFSPSCRLSGVLPKIHALCCVFPLFSAKKRKTTGQPMNPQLPVPNSRLVPDFTGSGSRHSTLFYGRARTSTEGCRQLLDYSPRCSQHTGGFPGARCVKNRGLVFLSLSQNSLSHPLR